MLQAYHEMADFLTKQGSLRTRKRIVSEPPEELEEELREPIKKLKKLVPTWSNDRTIPVIDIILFFCGRPS